jgi:hypothetical protein
MNITRTRRATQQHLGQQHNRVLEAAAFASFALRVAEQHETGSEAQLLEALRSTMEALHRAAQSF